MAFEEIPRLRIGRRPVFTEDEGSDDAAVVESLLDSDAVIAADTRRTVAVDELKDGDVLVPGRGQFAFQESECFVNEGHAFFEVDSGNSVFRSLARLEHVGAESS